MLAGLRTAKRLAFDLRASMYPSITAPDATGAPRGALTPAAAESISQYMSKGVRDEWLRLKSDGSPSIGEFPEGVETVQVLRNNDFSTDRSINFVLNGPLLTPAYYLSIDGNAILN